MIPGAKFGDIDTGEAIITKVWTVPVTQEQKVHDLLEEYYPVEMALYRAPKINKASTTPAEARKLIQDSDDAVKSALIKLYGYQTEEEKLAQSTHEENAMGFNKPDSSYGSYLAKLILSGIELTPGQLNKAREILLKYSKQLVGIEGLVISDDEKAKIAESAKVISHGKNCKLEVWSGFREDASHSTIDNLTKEDMRSKWSSLIKDQMTIKVEAYENHDKLAEWIKPYRMVADLSADKSHIDITSKFEDKDLVKSMPGATWDMNIKKWKLPLTRGSVSKLQGYDSQISNEIYDAIINKEKETSEMQDIAHSKDIRISHPLANKLRDYQRTGVAFLTKSPKAILGDDMGLGKTITAMIASDELGCKKTLVIAPNTLKRNWAKEYEKWGILPEEKITVVAGDSSTRKQLISDFNTGALIINYDNVRPSESRDTNLDDLLKKEWDAVIIDEAHKIKHYNSQQTIGVKQLAHSAKKACYVLTGTPPGEIDFIWNLLNAIRPDLYPDRWKFIREYGSVIKELIPTKKGLQEVTKINPRPTSPKRFKEEVLDPLMIRRLKSDKLPELPEKQYREVWVDMEPAQAKIYEDMLKQEFAQLSEEKSISAMTVLSKLNRLRQIAVSPDIMGEEITDIDRAIKRSNKIQAMLDIINGIDGKVIVFSQYERAISLACAALDKEKISYVRYTGKENEKVRDQSVDRFMNNPDTKVMLMTTAAGGVGLTLTAAADAIFLDKMWNPEDNNQAEDRIHRLGQASRHVTIHELLSENTLDTWVEQILKSKTSVDAAVMDIVNKYHDSLAIAKQLSMVSHKETIGTKKAVVRQLRVPNTGTTKQVNYKIANTGINKLTT